MTFLRVYGVGVALAIASIGGLVFALIFDGVVDALALVFVAAPIVVIVRHLLKLRVSEGETASRP